MSATPGSAYVRVSDPKRGVFIGWVDDNSVYDVSTLTGGSLLALMADGSFNDPGFLWQVRKACAAGARHSLGYDTISRNTPGDGAPHLLLPFEPPEVWGAGVTYRKAAELHELDLAAEGKATGLYDYVFASDRPEIFFKGVARHCVGHNDRFSVRGDSTGTMIEAELGCVYNRHGAIVGYTVANDVTAWDLEKECPLFLSYAKVFTGSCAFGPGVVPAALVPDPMRLAVRCCIDRDGATIYDGRGNTSFMKRTLDELTRHLFYCNDAPDGTLLCTGTAVGIPNDLVIQEGDRVTMAIEGIGELVTTATTRGRESSDINKSPHRHTSAQA